MCMNYCEPSTDIRYKIGKYATKIWLWSHRRSWNSPTLHNYPWSWIRNQWEQHSLFRCYYRYIKKNDLIRIAFDFFRVSFDTIYQFNRKSHVQNMLWVSLVSRIAPWIYVQLVVLFVMTSRQRYFSQRSQNPRNFFGWLLLLIFFLFSDKSWLAAILNANALPCFLDCCRRGQEKYFDL